MQLLLERGDKMFTKLSIRWQVLLPTVAVLLIFGIVTVHMVSRDIEQATNKQLGLYREEQIAAVRQRLQDHTEVAFQLIASMHEDATDTDYLQAQYGQDLRNIIDVCETAIREAMRSGTDEAAAKAQAMDYIRKLRYQDGSGYVWINDTGRPIPKMVMHPDRKSVV